MSQYVRTAAELEIVDKFTPNTSFPEFARSLAKPGEKLLAEATPLKMNLNHMIIGGGLETDELAEAILHGRRGEVGVLKPKDSKDGTVVEESGDWHFYTTEKLRALGVTLYDEFLSAPAENPTGKGVHELFLLFCALKGQLGSHVRDFTIYNKHVLEGTLDDKQAALADDYRAHLEAMAIAVYSVFIELLAHYNLTIRDIEIHNFIKLGKRYATVTGGVAYTDEAAALRADKQ